eukprot:s1260_g17.t1
MATMEVSDSSPTEASASASPSSEEASYWPFPWPRHDIDGGRQSPFEDEDDYDYDSCCGPEGHEWKPPTDLVLPGTGTKMDTAEIVANSVKDQEMGSETSPDAFIVNGEVLGEASLPGLRGYKRRGAPPLSPVAQRPRLEVPFVFGR